MQQGAGTPPNHVCSFRNIVAADRFSKAPGAAGRAHRVLLAFRPPGEMAVRRPVRGRVVRGADRQRGALVYGTHCHPRTRDHRGSFAAWRHTSWNPDRSVSLCSNWNTTGVAMRDNSTEKHNAPMTAIAKGLSMSAPEPMP